MTSSAVWQGGEGITAVEVVKTVETDKDAPRDIVDQLLAVDDKLEVDQESSD
jgi:hypothetical protein